MKNEKKLSPELKQKLKGYSAAAGAIIALGQVAEAQIVYTDVNPDSLAATTYSFDFDGNSVIDLELSIGATSIKADIGDVAGATMFSTVYASVLNSSQVIDSGAFYSNSYSGYGGPPVIANSNIYGSAWNNTSNGYLGVKFDIGGSIHYGWVELSIAGDGVTPYELTVHGYAYNSLPGASIMAGQRCVMPGTPIINPPQPVCPGSTNTLTVSSGNLNDATSWEWYSGSCGGTHVGSGVSIDVSPIPTTTYYVQGEGGACLTPGPCAAVTVVTEDLDLPVLAGLPDQTVSKNENCEFVMPNFADSTSIVDLCDPNPTITQSPQVGFVITNDTTVVITATDLSSNADSISFDVFLVDDTDPVFSYYNDTTVCGDGTIVNYPAITASDNCSVPTVTLVSGQASGSSFSSGVNIVEYTATDDAGNIANCQFNVIVEDEYLMPQVQSICDSDSLFLEGAWQNMSGTYYDTLMSSAGCDSVIETTLIVNPTYLETNFQTICAGDSIFLQGEYQNTTGIYFDYLSSVNGCDSTITTSLTVLEEITTQSAVSICMGDSVFVEGAWQTTAGIYTDTLISENGCDSIVETQLTILDVPVISLVNVTNNTCFGDNDGSIDISITNGSAPYTYLWSNGYALEDLTGLTAGTYSVLVSDLKGCTASLSQDITEPAELVVSATGTDAECGVGLGAASLATPTGGTSPYTILWSNNETTQDISGLMPGSYNVTVTDDNLCQKSTSVDVNVIGTGSVALTANQINCYGQTANATVTMTNGISPISYQWSDGQSGPTAYDLISGTYHVTVIDDLGCGAEDSVVIAPEPAQLFFYITTQSAGCTGCDGVAEATVSGGTSPYNYSWSEGSSDLIAGNLCGDTPYYLTVTDANGCSMTTGTYIGSQLLPQLNGQILYEDDVFNAGDVNIELYHENLDSIVSFSLVTSVDNSAGGVFSFVNLLPDTYYMRLVVNNDSAHTSITNTYYANTYSWDASTPIQLVCNDNTNLNITMYEVPPVTGGGTVSGYITYGDANSKSVGDPVPGAEVYIEQEPNDEPIASDDTDTTGYYAITNLPFGSNYGLVVDIPGFPLLTTHTDITISDQDTVIEDMNFYVDESSGSMGIYAENTSAVSEFSVSEFSLSVYPNPVSDVFNVSYQTEISGSVEIEVLDINGKLIESISHDDQIKGKYTEQIDTKDWPANTYLIKFRFNNNYFIKKIVKLN